MKVAILAKVMISEFACTSSLYSTSSGIMAFFEVLLNISNEKNTTTRIHIGTILPVSATNVGVKKIKID